MLKIIAGLTHESKFAFLLQLGLTDNWDWILLAVQSFLPEEGLLIISWNWLLLPRKPQCDNAQWQNQMNVCNGINLICKILLEVGPWIWQLFTKIKTTINWRRLWVNWFKSLTTKLLSIWRLCTPLECVWKKFQLLSAKNWTSVVLMYHYEYIIVLPDKSDAKQW